MTGANRRSRVRLPRRRFSLALGLLVASVGVTAIAAFNAQRAVLSHQRTANGLLRDYAAFAAWSTQHEVASVLEGAVMAALQYIMHGRDLHENTRHGPVPNADDLWRYYNSQAGFRTRFCTPKRCPESFPPAAYFGFTLGADTLRVALGVATPDGDAWLQGASAGDRRWLVDSLSAHVRRVHDFEQNYEIIASPRFGAGRMLAYALMPTAYGDTVVYGVEFGSSSSRHIFRDAFASQPLLPKALMRGRGNDELLGVRVVGTGLLPLYESPRWPSSPYVAAVPLPAQFGALIVQAAIRPAYASQLVIGGLPRSRLPLLLGMLFVSMALAVVAVAQVRREEELARLRSDFVSSVSHELRTPLAQIRLFLETLRLGRFTTDAQRQWSLDNIDRETNRLVHLVENVLHFARAGRPAATAAVAEATNLASEIEQISSAFEPLAASRRAALELDLAPNVVVPLQREAFRQVLLNLLDNAVKYGPGGQTVRVSLAAVGTSARVTVTDEGPGIPVKEREAIWTPFFRGGVAAAQGTGGSGIGLAIVKDLADRMGARVSVTSGNGRGATFQLELPGVQTSRARPNAVDDALSLTVT